MKVLALDLETTGLDPVMCQVLEVGAVYADVTRSGVKILGTYKTIIKHERIIGEEYALKMNSHLLCEPSAVTATTFEKEFKEFLSKCRVGDYKITLIGKNVGVFDLPFLYNMTSTTKISLRNYFHRRILDIGSMFVRENDICTPDLKECLVRAGFEKSVQHETLADCSDVLACFQNYLERTCHHLS